MAAGTPVLCARLTSLPEVAGDAALYVEEFSMDEIAERMITLATDDDVRRRLIDLGRQRALLFSWEETARKTLEIYAEVAERPAAEATLQRRAIAELERM